MTAKALVWLRNDLRLADNPALHAASKLGGTVTALFVHETNPQLRAPGGAVRWWLEQSLNLLEKSLNERNIELIVAEGEALNIIEQLIEENGFDTVFWNRRYAPQEREVDALICPSSNDLRLFGLWKIGVSGSVCALILAAFAWWFKRRCLIVSLLILSRLSRMVWPRPK